ncbi:SAV_2336 N-terminal domain-related protein [Kitasatospora purpeofusca]|uniref:SAV_2336 N-terminal domain-related protein n=1 Tax=Kitasatospora purpeofusca TaxID=67352 RepID=UPI00068C02A3|nr:SAV_2336 N-terminal domain-related protein [Kitasatospora purpeofusca]
MPDRTADLLTALSRFLPPDTDPAALADALWLAAGRVPSGAVPESPLATTPPPAPAPSRPTDPDAPAAEDLPEADPPEAGPPVYDGLAAGSAPTGVRVRVAAARALPHTLELGRALRPFKRRYPHGPRQVLDFGATMAAYARDGDLAPVFRPAPEPWFEAVVLTDSSPTMAIWQDSADEFTTLLAGLGAFRRITSLRLDPGPEPAVEDLHGRPVAHGRLAGTRRLVVVLSDCAAPAWHDGEVWRLLRHWGTAGPVALLNPLPGRLWNRTALDLPAVRARHRVRPGRNTELDHAVPLMLTALFGADAGWVPLPTLSFTPHSLGRWANGMMRGAPAGFDAVLVPASGTLTSPFLPEGEPEPEDTHRRIAAFLHTASPEARRMAALCSPFGRLSLPLLRLVRQEVVPEAGTEDLAEVLTSGLFDLRSDDGSVVLTIRPEAREALAPRLTRHDAWTVQSALTRHIASRHPGAARALEGIAVPDAEQLPPDLRPFAVASAEIRALLEAGRRPRAKTAAAPADREAPATPRFPDPARSAAVLIGLPPRIGPLARPRDRAGLDALHEVLTSPTSWGLGPDRCRVLFDPADPAAILTAIEQSSALAEDSLLVYLQGPVAVLPFGDLARILRARGNAPTVLLLDGAGAPQLARALDLETLGAGYGLSVLVSRSLLPERDGSFAVRLAHLAAQGLVGGPDVLDLDTVDRVLAQEHTRSSTSDPGLWFLGPAAPLALLRNRLAEDFLDPAVRHAYEAVAAELKARNAGIPRKDQELMRALVSFAHGRDLTAAGAWNPAQLSRSLANSLKDFLEPAFTLVRETGGDEGRWDFSCRRADGGIRALIDVRTVTGDGPAVESLAVPDRTSARLRIVFLLDRTGGARLDHLLNLTPDVGVVPAPGSGTACAVLFRIPVVLTDESAGRRRATAYTAAGRADPLWVWSDRFARLADLPRSRSWAEDVRTPLVTRSFPGGQVNLWDRSIPVAALFTDHLPELRTNVEALRRTETASRADRTQLCVAVFEADAGSWVADDLRPLQRAVTLLGTKEGRAVLDQDPDSPIAIVVSDELYRELTDSAAAGTVRAFMPFLVRDEERRSEQAWLGLPGRTAPEIIGLLRAVGTRSIPRNSASGYSVAELRTRLRQLGVRQGELLLVEVDDQELGPEVHPERLLTALLDVLGEQGTLVMSAATPENSLRSPFTRRALEGLTPEAAAAYRDAMPPFDPDRTPVSARAGRLAELLRQLPGSVRSRHPQQSFVALGRDADHLMAEHALIESHIGYAFGPESPLGRLMESDARMLLLGVPPEQCVVRHHLTAYEDLLSVTESCVVAEPDGTTGRRWLEYETLDLLRAAEEAPPPLMGLHNAWFPVLRGSLGRASVLLVPIVGFIGTMRRRDE